jgi:hypothetical protein
MTVLIASTSAAPKGRRHHPGAPMAARCHGVGTSLQPLDLGMEELGIHGKLTHLGPQPIDRHIPIVPRPRRQARRPAIEKGVPPPAQIRRRHREIPRHDLQRLAPQHPQHRVLLAPRCHAPLPARSRDRSDIRGLRARGSAALNVIHLDTSVGSDKPSRVSQGTLGRGTPNGPSTGVNRKGRVNKRTVTFRNCGSARYGPPIGFQPGTPSSVFKIMRSKKILLPRRGAASALPGVP